MKTHAFLILALCGMFLPLATQALPQHFPGMPSTNEVVKYSRYNPREDKWLEVSKTDGDTILTCLLDHENFTDWLSTLPAGIAPRMAPDPWHFHVAATNGFYTFSFSAGARTVAILGKRRLVVPDAEREILLQLFNSWIKADQKRLTSQPLPCQFIVGSVAGGDTLSGIARLFYGDATKWPVIHEANKAAIKNPDLIEFGMVITIPKLETTPP